VLAFIGCRCSHYSSYGADIGDSIFVYIRDFPSDVKKTHIGGISVYYNYWDFPYVYYIENDSMTYQDDFDVFEKCQIKREKNELTIIKNIRSSELFRLEGLDSIVLYKVSNSYIDKRDGRKYIRKSHFYNNVINWNKYHKDK
jgi:hypothetical protein